MKTKTSKVSEKKPKRPSKGVRTHARRVKQEARKSVAVPRP